ncbi:sodium--glutamate symport carrier GltS [Pseudomonas sp. GM21]|jgi:ESS family glutamate:Na+ symporter|uniref:sodium/glutamate symporter n=1 Tax=Pseudomonas TaxID=286 RepID=UPI0002723640|nr:MULTISPECIES: sodium/glutamate symporter [Pseudomonas]EJM10435.1 sodium--glutamate symport carrier GltS [Pseudomonas sp. GM21]MDR6924190.1 ESS family glutamate:Na+ symporter [Pseudomonas sp. BE134]MDR7283086.1 ESS family glutamate:Na+ symporter [Pseudomonas corrugata]
MTPQLFSVHGLVSFTLAILLLFLGKTLVQKNALLRQYCIPESVVGGFVCAAVTSLLYFGLNIQVEFDLQVRDTLLLYFFAGIGLKSDMRQLLKGGRPLLILLVLAGVFIVLQNALGMGVAEAFGLDPKAGLMVGSISLTGGAGTTLAWAPLFIEKLGINNAHELGMASNTVGLIAACVIGGPIANRLIRRNRLKTSGDAALEVGILEDQPNNSLNYYDVLWAWMWLNLTLMLGYGLNLLLVDAGITLPKFVSCLFAGIVIHHIVFALVGEERLKSWSGASLGLSLISDICLGMFLTMALMGLQLWQLSGVLGFIVCALTLQILLTVLYTYFVVFRFMGRDYEASVIASGFGGIALGSTATAIVNMTTVTQKYGAAHQAFLIVPLVCGFFIDLVNAVIIGLFSGI